MVAGKQVRLFLADGSIGGLITAEIMNWTGHILKGKRPQLSEMRQRGEAQRPGVYILTGTHGQTGGPVAYIGMGDDVARRLGNPKHRVNEEQHDWTDVTIVTSKDANLTSAHIRYLESRLIRLAKAVDRIPLDNGNEPSGGAELPEADESDMDYFIDQLQILLPVVGVELFRGRRQRSEQSVIAEPAPGPSSPIFELTNGAAGTHARAQLVDGEFTVLAGSRVRAKMPDSRHESPATARQYERRQRIHAALIEDGSIVESDNGGVLTRDVVFSSPSAAGSVVQGRASCNGLTKWRTTDGLQYGAWLDS